MGLPARVVPAEQPLTLRPLPGYEPGDGVPAAVPPRDRPALRVVTDLLPDTHGESVSNAVRGVIRRLLAAVVEVLDGRRPVDQLRTQLTPMAHAALRTRVVRSSRTPGKLRSLHLCAPGPRVVEACATIEVGGRVRAMAARFELAGDAVRCTVLRLL
ncbi:hypothetical protein GCM10010174_11540 [Kutzneria viridogrisea]|uniref:Uncharacterized protein n=2 Tax=Kutzneria TaxID=43356 RepID=W5WL20_9PSEU|nr:Rv3235 family protein [Kutzneria albida]AHI01242.1 hypothetical protein KALB_7884 [Kutzneria albida DSM 43870]MBA8926496.1 hypothetical protein [Kutzneria viridogrisea]